jgi:hypothetical protein
MERWLTVFAKSFPRAQKLLSGGAGGCESQQQLIPNPQPTTHTNLQPVTCNLQLIDYATNFGNK